MTRPAQLLLEEPRPATVAGSVFRAACQSAPVSDEALASASGLRPEDIRALEDGSEALASMPLPEVSHLQNALRQAGADPQLVADIVAAAWCDVVLEAMFNGEDMSCLMADPISRETAFGELFLWSLGGQVPARYLPGIPRTSHDHAGRPAAPDPSRPATGTSP